jgi:hypothetical protein
MRVVKQSLTAQPVLIGVSGQSRRKVLLISPTQFKRHDVQSIKESMTTKAKLFTCCTIATACTVTLYAETSALHSIIATGIIDEHSLVPLGGLAVVSGALWYAGRQFQSLKDDIKEIRKHGCDQVTAHGKTLSDLLDNQRTNERLAASDRKLHKQD